MDAVAVCAEDEGLVAWRTPTGTGAE
jgi:hypothetical protein